MATVIRVPTSCLETVGERPTLSRMIDTRPDGCPDGMACLDNFGMAALATWIDAANTWMEQAELGCSEEDDDKHENH